MENLSNQTTTTESPDINTHEVEGRKLQVIWNKRQAVWTKDFKADTQSDGFDTRLGKLIRELKLESDSRQIASSRLRDCSLHSIDKRRRSEALWFVENEKECRSFMQTSKKGFTSLTALQAAMRKANKSDDTTGDTDVEPTEKAEKESKVGQLDTTVKMDKFELAKIIQEICLSNKIDDAELIEILMLNAEANIQQKAA
mgnify:FL=1|jgi:hypothetical protein|tara:strand:- start:15 stop:611 length:597 start_codon:yes stop_codon:yes gene_type:complete